MCLMTVRGSDGLVSLLGLRLSGSLACHEVVGAMSLPLNVFPIVVVKQQVKGIFLFFKQQPINSDCDQHLDPVWQFWWRQSQAPASPRPRLILSSLEHLLENTTATNTVWSERHRPAVV